MMMSVDRIDGPAECSQLDQQQATQVSTTGPTVTGSVPTDMNVGLEIVKLQKFCLYLLEKIQKLEPSHRKK